MLSPLSPDFHHALRPSPVEVHLVGHQKHRAWEPVQRPGQGLLGCPVQVVGGLVQQEKVAGPQGEQAQLDRKSVV